MLFHSLWTDSQISDWILNLSGEILWKSLVVALVALLLVRILRNASASLRHTIASSALVALLVIPVGVVALPAWKVLPQFSQSTLEPVQQGRAPSIVAPHPAKKGLSGSALVESDSSLMHESDFAQSSTSPLAGSTPKTPTAGAWIAMIWLTVSTCFLLNLVRQVFALYRHARSCNQCTDGRITEMVNHQSDRLQLSRPQVFVCQQQLLPMVWGIFRPRLVLPSSAKSWTDDQLSNIITHELAHLKRRDPLTITVGQLAKAIHWFNPLVWMLNRQMIVEQEKACDNHVVKGSLERSNYAALILSMTAVPQSPQVGTPVSVAMARPLQIEKRIRSILSPNENRNPTSFLMVLAILAFTLTTGGFISSLSARQVPSKPDMYQDPSEAPAEDKSTRQDNKTLIRAVRFLESVQKEDGSFPSQPGNIYQNGTTALTAIALLHVDEIADREALGRSLARTLKLKPSATYDMALTLIALCHMENPKYNDEIAKLIAKLGEFQAKRGQYTGGWSYVQTEMRADGSNTRFAVWALMVAHELGHDVPADVVNLATDYWLQNQRADGGWSYVGPSTPPTATMTMSGIACLSWLKPMLDEDDPRHAEIEAAIVKAWSLPGLDEALKADRNWPLYAWHIYSLAAQATDRDLKDLNVDAIPTAEQLNDHLRKIQRRDGSFGRPDSKTIATSLAILTAQE